MEPKAQGRAVTAFAAMVAAGVLAGGAAAQQAPLAVGIVPAVVAIAPGGEAVPGEAIPGEVIPDLDRLDAFARAVAEDVAANPALRAFYAGRDYAPIWTRAEDAGRRAAFFAALDGAGAQGLPAPRYGAAELRAAFATIRSERERGLLEARMSRVWLRYARDVSTGALDPKRIDPGIVRDIPRRDPLGLIRDFAAAGAPARYLRDLAPQGADYAALLQARLALGSQIVVGGGSVPLAAAKLGPGAAGPEVAALRAHLAAMGYDAGGRDHGGQDYDGTLQKAVQRFQRDNGLVADGVAGPATLAALNRTPEDRMKAILVAMERLRWMNGLDLGQRHVWVNIPDFTAEIVDDGKVTFRTVTVVGKDAEDRRTPEFSDEMEMIVINPTWHVPRSITVKEYLPKLQRDPNAASQILVVDKQGREVPRGAVNFSAYTAETFPFRMRQAPSDDNALGLVKFLFPNPWNIYLHDTPSKSLFAKDMRAFSHGCIRIGDPFDLAYRLLAPQQADPEAYFQKILKTGKETTVRLDPPVPVHLVYFTAWPEEDGRIGYRADVYGRDAALFAALEKAGVELAVPTN